MPGSLKDSLTELQTIISKMSFEACCLIVLPDMGLQIKDIAKAVTEPRLRMSSRSISQVLKIYAAKSFTPEQLENIVSQLKLKLVATSGTQVWHTIKLSEPIYEREPVTAWSQKLPSRVLAAAERTSRRDQTAHVEINSTQMGDFVYLSLRRVSRRHVGSPLYVCACAGQCVAFVTSLASTGLIRAAVQGIGYKSYENAALYGPDLQSLLRIIDRTWNVPVNRLTEIPEYEPKPVITAQGIDYTHKTYDEQYIDNVIGPDPPLLTDLEITSTGAFHDPQGLAKKMSVSLTLKSENISETLKHWVQIKALRPTSDLITAFHQMKSNQFTYERDSDVTLMSDGLTLNS